jgi:hypothetical protein
MENKLTKEEIQEWQTKIDGMSHVDMCSMVRYAPCGHPCFDRTIPEVSDYFNDRYQKFGGMTPEISKQIGWGR